MEVNLKTSCLICNIQKKDYLIVYDGMYQSNKPGKEADTNTSGDADTSSGGVEASTSKDESMDTDETSEIKKQLNTKKVPKTIEEERSVIMTKKGQVVYKYDLPGKLSRVLGIDMMKETLHFINSVICRKCFKDVCRLDRSLDEIGHFRVQFNNTQNSSESDPDPQKKKIADMLAGAGYESVKLLAPVVVNVPDVDSEEDSARSIFRSDIKKKGTFMPSDGEMDEIFENVLSKEGVKMPQCSMSTKMMVKDDDGELTKVQCFACGKVFSSMEEMYAHAAEARKKRKAILQQHKKMMGKPPPDCSLNSHQLCQLEDGTLVKVLCLICSKEFQNIEGFKQHVEEAMKIKAEYEENQQTFSGRRSTKFDPLRSRQKSHICDTCGKIIVGKYSYFKRHVRDHTERPYMCESCPKAFSRMNALIDHRRLHTGEKPYACEVCDKRFRQKQHVKTHYMGVHAITHQKPELCSQCGKQFSTLSSFKNHKKECGKTEAITIELMQQDGTQNTFQAGNLQQIQQLVSQSQGNPVQVLQGVVVKDGEYQVTDADGNTIILYMQE